MDSHASPTLARSSSGASALDQDRVERLRRVLFDRHGVNLPARDPICTEFTMFSEVIDELLQQARSERELELDELRAIVHGVGSAVATAIEDASQPAARAMDQVLDPRAIADRVCSELCDDLERTTWQVVQDVRLTIIGMSFATCLLTFLLVLIATEHLPQLPWHLASWGHQPNHQRQEHP